ncbi:MAG: hypothetical protein RJA29_707, partial [Pseudomonadota bacterium]
HYTRATCELDARADPESPYPVRDTDARQALLI